ncbi:conserved Plasmodium protein, unknown function [Plasmodium vivax]|uniref:Uncharacterized protein n=1 Tax=Plasmodium vivax TaxID=5855 RepID=A0A564ZRG7_PLAVI|nr:conserved Plasmodium protein, unknown function [Plasmodium vivax]VUZ94420.1 conserved Plasmodium protein, unknown function [Plasmodium vivax]
MEHTVPLYERRSRAKLKREKQLRKVKGQVLHLGWSARLGGPSRARAVGSSSYAAHLEDANAGDTQVGVPPLEVPPVGALPEIRADESNASSLPFTHAKRLFLSISRKRDEELLKRVSSAQLVHVCVFMVKKNVRCRPVEEEFLRRVSVSAAVSEEAVNPVGFALDAPLLRADNLLHLLEFIHHIGLNNLGARQRGCPAWRFSHLKRVYNALLSEAINGMMLSKGHLMEIIRINDRYLHFDESLFNYIDGTIASTFHTYDEHDVACLCRHLNKILFFFSLQRHGVRCDMNVHRLVKRYVCKSLVFSPEVGQHRWGGPLGGVAPPHGGDAVPPCSGGATPPSGSPLLLHPFRELIRRSSLVQTLNRELSRSAHEYKYYNLVELLEFYSLFEVKKKEMVKRLINEIDKHINIMRYGYHAKALILLSLNRKHLDGENEKSVRRLIRRTSQMLHFYWPVEFIIETIIACCSFLERGNKTLRNLFLYLKGNIKKCIHPVLLVNLLKSLASRRLHEMTVCTQIEGYVKERRDSIHEVHEMHVVHILKYLALLNHPSDKLFVFFLSSEGALSRVARLPSESLVNLLHVVSHYRGGHRSGGAFRVGNILVRSSAAVFFSEYVMFLLLRRGWHGNWANRGAQGEGTTHTVHEEKTSPNVRGEANHSGAPHLPRMATLVQLLNALTNLKVTNQDMLHYVVSHLQGGLPHVGESHVVTLFQFFSEHLINCPSVGEALTRQTYVYLHHLARETIMKLPEEYLLHCAFATLTYYFVDHIMKKNRKNVNLLEKMMIIFGRKIRAGLNILTEENEEKKASSELLHVISAVLKRIYGKIERRLPDELFTLCTHVERHVTARGDTVRGGRNHKMASGQCFLFFFSDLFKSKKIPHFVNYFSYPYTIDMVIPGGADTGGVAEQSGKRPRALFLIDRFDQMYLRNVPVGRFFGEEAVQMGERRSGQTGERRSDQLGEQQSGQRGERRSDQMGEDPSGAHRTAERVYQNEDVRTCLKPYEAIREWFLSSQNFAVSYVSLADWAGKHM